jgi:hypothetical protein
MRPINFYEPPRTRLANERRRFNGAERGERKMKKSERERGEFSGV